MKILFITILSHTYKTGCRYEVMCSCVQLLGLTLSQPTGAFGHEWNWMPSLFWHNITQPKEMNQSNNDPFSRVRKIVKVKAPGPNCNLFWSNPILSLTNICGCVIWSHLVHKCHKIRWQPKTGQPAHIIHSFKPNKSGENTAEFSTRKGRSFYAITMKSCR